MVWDLWYDWLSRNDLRNVVFPLPETNWYFSVYNKILTCRRIAIVSKEPTFSAIWRENNLNLRRLDQLKTRGARRLNLIWERLYHCVDVMSDLFRDWWFVID